jgi:hypothetical protein
MKTYFTVVINRDGSVEPIFHDENRKFFGNGKQKFRAVDGNYSWLGFYDWLRSKAGLVLGVRLKFDEDENVDLIRPFVGRQLSLDKKTVLVRFVLDGEPVDEISGDADFSGNEIFFGDQGSLAIAFYAPRFVSL